MCWQTTTSILDWYLLFVVQQILYWNHLSKWCSLIIVSWYHGLKYDRDADLVFDNIKYHQLSHIVEQTKRFGPLKYSSTQDFEHHHRKVHLESVHTNHHVAYELTLLRRLHETAYLDSKPVRAALRQSLLAHKGMAVPVSQPGLIYFCCKKPSQWVDNFIETLTNVQHSN